MTDERTAAMDALIADSADLYDAPASADALGEVERVPCDGIEAETAAWDWLEAKFGNSANDPVDRVYAADEMIDAFHAGAGWRFKATAAMSAMSPAGEVEKIVAWLRSNASIEHRHGPAITRDAFMRDIADAIERGDYRHDR